MFASLFNLIYRQRCLADAVTHTRTVETTCPTGVDLIHCFHTSHDMTSISATIVLGLVSAGLVFGLILFRRS